MALSVVDRINKRAFYPAKLPNGETVCVRAVRNEIINKVVDFKAEESSVGYLIGHGLVDDSGSLVFTEEKEESPQAFGWRVLVALHDMGPDVRKAIVDKILLCTNEPSQVAMEAIVKN